MTPRYFDYNATTPVLPEVFEAMRPYLTDRFGNPSSPHAWGLAAHEGLEAARAQVADLIHARPDEIVFTSCATESNNTVITGLLGASEGRFVTSAIEHPAVLAPARALRGYGVETALLPVGPAGVVDPADLPDLLDRRAKLVSVMLANNETGALQPVAEIAAIARSRHVPMHTDAAQAVGKIPVDVRALDVDCLTIAGHKLYAPKGVGALYVRAGKALPPLLHGGGQEHGRRSGTENVAYAVALGAACALASRDLEDEGRRQRTLGQRLLAALRAAGLDFVVHAENAPRLPNTLSLGFKNADASRLVETLALNDVAVSAGAACHPGGGHTLSPVLSAMHIPDDYARGTLRISLGRPTTEADIDALAAHIEQAVRQGE